MSDYPGYFPDWFPTLCAAAGLTVPAGLDGVNLLPVLTGQGEPPERNPMIWIFPEYGGQMAIQMGTYKMIRAGLSQARPGPWELYDLNADPAEQTHIAASHPEHVERMRRVLGAQWGDNDVFGPDRETSLTP